MSGRPRILVITGYGLNCEAESCHAWARAGAAPEAVHLSDLLADPSRLDAFAGLMFIGGFSFGDHMTSGHVMAVRLRHRLGPHLERFLDRGGLALGVCNGFQIMVKLGLVPGLPDPRASRLSPQVALMANDCGAFQNRWVRVRFEPDSPCVFTRGLDTMPLPVRHGEGKLFVPRKAVLEAIEAAGCVACRYIDPETGAPADRFPANPNGSVHAIAGLCDPTGRVFGLMPHPEAYLYPENHPTWDFEGSPRDEGEGLALFRNAVEFLRAG